MSVGTWIERRARIAPDHPALIHGRRTVTYRELAGRIRRLSNGLERLGVERGDRVAWMGENHPAFLESLFAAGLIGAVLAPVNHRLPPAVRAAILADTEPRVLIEHGIEENGLSPSSIRHRLLVGAGSSGAGSAGSTPYEELVASSPDHPVRASVGFDDLLLLPHTSGTSGSPKCVMLTHGNLTWNALHFLACADFRADDVTVAIAPFFRTGGIGVNVLPLLLKGGTVVVPGGPGADEVLDAIEHDRVSIGFGNPDLLDQLVRSRRWATADLTSVRFILTGGAPVPDRLVRAYLDRGVPLVQGYGLSEAAPLVLLLDQADAIRKAGAAGHPPPFIDIRIVDGSGVDVARGEIGELLARGPNVMAGYWRRPAESAAALRDGWLWTGDAARMDEEGSVWIVDRMSARLTTPEGPVFPGAVERVLLEHQGVADVGVTTDAGSGSIVALVVADPGASLTQAGLIGFARTRLPGHAVPTRITFVDALPRSSVGKLQRKMLRELAASRAPR